MTALEARLDGVVGSLEVNVSLTVPPGVLALLGPNGAGKTSLLKLLLGALRPRAGTVSLGGRVLFDAAAGLDVPVEDRELGYLPQGFALFPHLTALGNVEFGVGCRAPQLTRAERVAEAQRLLAEVGAAAVGDRRPATLSGGERQAVALARALASRPKALLLDEPLASLDVGARRRVRAALRERLAAAALPALVVTHSFDDAAALGDRCAVLEQGQLVQLGTPAELRAAPATEFVAALVEGVTGSR